jgi:parallel beta-helix repeat protein
MYIEQSARVTVHNSEVRHGQNALCLDRVVDSRIYDNDFSFNSGWGVALWRCSSNVISRNALDFCVRGYSHGVYNRGQDSAGIFAFEQNNGNIIAENSVTHGGDGFFGFAGREALGETGDHPVEWYQGRGNSGNLLVRNDFSYAAAHGIENTFSFGNQYLANRIVGNAICGIWAGYSRRTLIAGNIIEDNGEMGYGLERGGINIDHGGDNAIVANHFSNNKCGVHLWGGANPAFGTKKWAQANNYASTGSVVSENSFKGDALAFQFRGPGEVTLGSNQLVGVAKEMLDDPLYRVRHDEHLPMPLRETPEVTVLGKTHPVGARSQLRGRQNIIMTEWGPWDHASPLARLLKSAGASAVYEILKVPTNRLAVQTVGHEIASQIKTLSSEPDHSLVTVRALKPGVRSFNLKLQADGKPLDSFAGTLVAADWQVTFFKWPPDIDPRTHLEAYRKLADGPGAVSDVLDQLSLKYGLRGPSDLGLSPRITAAKLGRDHFGMVARTRLPLGPGSWEFATESDDGVRVTVDGKPLIENWTWHGPTRDTGTFELADQRTVDITVEHFQIDGYAVLELSVTPKPADKRLR